MGRHVQPTCGAGAGGAHPPRLHTAGSLAARPRRRGHRRPVLWVSGPALASIAVFAVSVCFAVASPSGGAARDLAAYEAGGVASSMSDGAAHGPAADRARRAIDAVAVAAGSNPTNAVTSLAVVLAVTLVLGGAVLVGFFSRKPKRAIEAQVTDSLNLGARRPRFQYVEYKQEVSLKQAHPEASIAVARRRSKTSVEPNASAKDPHLNATDRHSGYIDVGTGEEPMFDDDADAVIARSKSLTPSVFSGLPRRPSSSTFEAFLSFEGAAGSFPETSPRRQAAITVAGLPDDDDEETFNGFGGSPFGESPFGESPLMMGESSGVNPLFGMMGESDDEHFGGFEAADATDEAGFGFGGELNANDFGSSSADGGGEEEKFGFGAGFGVVAVLPDGTIEKIDSALDVLNNRETTIEEREEAIDVLLEIMKLEGGAQEVYEMNGAVTITAVMKEELDVEIQRKALMALNNICENPMGLAEVVTSGMVPTMVNALDVDALWFYALVILDNAKSNEIAIFTMLGEGVLPKLAHRASRCRDEFELEIMMDLIETLTKNAIKYENIGRHTFDAIACIIRNNPATREKAAMAVANTVATFGDRATSDVNGAGLHALLR